MKCFLKARRRCTVHGHPSSHTTTRVGTATSTEVEISPELAGAVGCGSVGQRGESRSRTSCLDMDEVVGGGEKGEERRGRKTPSKVRRRMVGNRVQISERK